MNIEKTGESSNYKISLTAYDLIIELMFSGKITKSECKILLGGIGFYAEVKK